MENYEAETLARKAARPTIYQVGINLGCFPVPENTTYVPGYAVKRFTVDGKDGKYAVQCGFNVLERESWEADPSHPYVITGTVGETWVSGNIAKYAIAPAQVDVSMQMVSTKDPSSQAFLSAVQIPVGTSMRVAVSSSFDASGNLSEDKMLRANDPDSEVSHAEGDYLVFKDVEGKPSYLELSEADRNSLEVAREYSPRIVNGTVMARTYDVASTREEIEAKYR